MPDFSKRSNEAELMDDLSSPKDILWQNLTEIELVNKYLGGYSVVLDALSEIGFLPGNTVSIMDMGCGGGDTLRVISKWLKKRSIPAKLTGIDWNPVMTEFCREHAEKYPDITFRTQDIFDPALIEEHPDIVICNLFCHHFDDQSLIMLLKRLYQMTGSGVIINDLHRHWLAYYSIKIITKIFSGSYMVQNDGPLSVARAFRRKDIQRILKECGITNYSISWCWAFRWKVVIKKHPGG